MDGFDGGRQQESSESSSEQPRGGTSSPVAQRGSGFEVPSISLPKGGGAIRGIGEKFAANPVTGTGSLTVPIATSPGRSGFGPQLSLSYDSGAGNGPFGLGWNLSLPSITRKTDKGLPQYRDADESDEFILSGAEDLVPMLIEENGSWEREKLDPRTVHGQTYDIQRYRPRIEGLFARIERWANQEDSADCFWRSISKDNITTWYGKTAESRIADPVDTSRIFSWLICESHDDKGNVIVYGYKAEDSTDVNVSSAHEANRTDDSRKANRYLKSIRYGNHKPYFPELKPAVPATPLPDDKEWYFEVVFDYEDHDHPSPTPLDYKARDAAGALKYPWKARKEPFSTYRAGFEVRTYRLCQRVLMFHHFKDEPGVGENCLVQSTDFKYRYEDDPTDPRNPIHSVLVSVTQSGYKRKADGSYLQRSLPPLDFTYSQATIDETINEVDAKSLENLPYGLDGSVYQWVDLDGEGLSGVLTEQAGAWYYKRNLSPGNTQTEDGEECPTVKLGPLERVTRKPSFSMAGAQLLDLAGDGQLDLVELDTPTPGFFERTHDEDWAPFRTFESLPNLNWSDPNLKFVDLTGDGHADILITENEAFCWHPSLAEAGFGPPEKVRQTLDEEKGPRLVFADGTQSIYLSDMSGDGLTDLSRIRNGEVCYWPNLGYGRFGAKVTMDNAPWFDRRDRFDQKRIRLADIDGSGVTDIIYLKADGPHIYLNHSGNSWSHGRRLETFPPIDNVSSVMALDLLGNGTACLVWSSPLPGNARQSMKYIDLMGGKKPHLLVRSSNNLGAETVVHYAPSTKFYVKDKEAGRPWITKVPFPVHVVERIETYDHINRNRFVTRYAYHHGYFDGVEREFRGFGMVEQWDTDEIGTADPLAVASTTNWDEASFVPPVYTKTWFHTGIYLGRNRVSNYFAGLLDERDVGEYYPTTRSGDPVADAEAKALLLEDTILPTGLTIDEEREACRALKGSMLRQEVYANDAGPEATEDQIRRSCTPYTVTEQNFTIQCLQAKGANLHGVFFAHPREAINYHYERIPDDPRVSHSVTLSVDEYGNVRRSVAVGYPRANVYEREPEQSETHITLTFNRFVNHSNQNDWYRIGLPIETRTYEVVKPPTRSPRLTWEELHDFVGALVPTGQEAPNAGNTIPYINWDWIRHWDPYLEPGGPVNSRLRLIEHVRTLYRPDDMGESRGNNPLVLLPLGEVESLAIPGETYKLAFTSELLEQVYQRNGQRLLPANPGNWLSGGGGDRGGYLNWDGDWWIPSGRMFYHPDKVHTATQELIEARQHFFVPRRYRDPFHKSDGSWDTETFVEYDTYDLLVQETGDTLDNRVTVGKRRQTDDTLEEQGNDYRVLQPRLMMDPNRNCSEVAFDALGLVVGTAVMGKPEDTPAKGDRLDSSFNADLTDPEIDAFFSASDPHLPAPGLLQNASTRIIYDLNRFIDSRNTYPGQPEKWEPVFAATLAREIHVSDLPASAQSKIQISFSYSDGFGREIQKKIQAEPGPVPTRDTAGNIVVGPDGQPEMTLDNISPRWVGSGWTIFNNKGKPVRQFEPFFSDTHLPDCDIRIGVSPVLFYDPVERVVATLHPNNTYEKVMFDPWEQATYDVNDTVNQDPRTDADIQGYVKKYVEALPASWQTWLQQRVINPSSPPADTGGANPEQDAAVRALKHADTPTLAYFDALGRTFLTVADNGNDSSGIPQKYSTRLILDVEGNQREVIDAKDRPVMQYDYDMLSNRIHQFSMEAGERWMLNDVTGKPFHAWDSRYHNFATEYDQLRRPITQWVQGTDAAQSDLRTMSGPIMFNKTEYGEGFANAIALNLRTRVYIQYDGAGVVTNMGTNPDTGSYEAYDFKGNLLHSSRQVTPDYQDIINWDTATPAGDIFSSRTTYDALNRPVTLTAPDNSVVRPTYNDANLLNALEANLGGVATATRFVTNIDYNAKGQRTQIEYATKNGAGVVTTYNYDPNTFRLVHLETSRAGFPPTEQVVQDLYYTYDPVGNITHIQDNADIHNVIYFRNVRVDPSNDYQYDAIYRLIQATGREHPGQAGTSTKHSYNDYYRINLHHPGVGNAIVRYCEEYLYDEVGNFKEMIHRRACPGTSSWRRSYSYDEESLLDNSEQSNRLSSTMVSGIDEIYSELGDGYDAHGNMLKMPHLRTLQWDYQDRLQMTQRQKVSAEPDEEGRPHHGERTFYVYDASGQRVRKVTELPTRQIKDERIYLGGFEVYRRYSGRNAGLIRETLHVMDDKQRIALVETRTQGNDASPPQLIRYQFGNHIGSACLELDYQAHVITYEEYTPYGSTSYQAVRQSTEVPTKRYRYTGKERDEESGLHYYGARYYIAWLCRWCSADPIGLEGGVNLYMFVNLNPITKIDLYGLSDSDAGGGESNTASGTTSGTASDTNIKIGENIGDNVCRVGVRTGDIVSESMSRAGNRTFYHVIDWSGRSIEMEMPPYSGKGDILASIQREGIRPSKTIATGQFGTGVYAFPTEEQAQKLAVSTRSPYAVVKVNPDTPVRTITVRTVNGIDTYEIISPGETTNVKPVSLEYRNVSVKHLETYHKALGGESPVPVRAIASSSVIAGSRPAVGTARPPPKASLPQGRTPPAALPLVKHPVSGETTIKSGAIKTISRFESGTGATFGEATLKGNPATAPKGAGPGNMVGPGILAVGMAVSVKDEEDLGAFGGFMAAAAIIGAPLVAFLSVFLYGAPAK